MHTYNLEQGGRVFIRQQFRLTKRDRDGASLSRIMEDLVIDGLPCAVSVQNEMICMDLQTRTHKRSFQDAIKFEDILSVDWKDNKMDCLQLSYVAHCKDRRLKVNCCELCGNTDTCTKLKQRIDNVLKHLNRPKRLLVFINPESGHRKAAKIYRTKVAPLFKLCKIQAQVIVTERPGQPKELLSSYDLRLLHGIVSVGGDGMYSECVNGLLERLQQDAGIDINDPSASIAASKIPIGIIPAGSGNLLVSYMHGTNDIETAVLKIILGDHKMTNVVSIHQGRQLSCYSSLLTEFGLIGDMMHDCEKFRWMGPARYNIIPLTTLLRRRAIDVEIEYMPAENTKYSPSARSRYLRQSSLPAHRHSPGLIQRLNSTPDHNKHHYDEWKKLDGRVFGVDTYVVSQKEKHGQLKPCFGDSALHMWVTDKCSLSKHTEQLTRLQKHKAGCWDFDFIRQVRAYGYRVKLISSATRMDEDGTRHLQEKFYINADGEALRLTHPEFEVRLHQNAIPIFGKVTS